MITAIEGTEVCLSASIIDGLVLARSAYNYNINHRSVMVFGRPEKVTDPDEKEAHLKTFVNRLIANQWDRLRPLLPKELKATTILSMRFDEASAKIRTGHPEDEPDDYTFPVWAGVIPIRQQVLDPVADPRNLPDVKLPPEALAFRF
jgi:nitroimidazol reductase NimA-like FMN-containing flavoprotein (pyridoxamine 5'-phosphate oxidase superfamily)